MTRSEFIDCVYGWTGLKKFCSNKGCDYCDCIYDWEERDKRIDDNLDYYAWLRDWQSLRDNLNDIPDVGGWYYHADGDYWYIWKVADDDMFEALKKKVLEWGDTRNIWDEEKLEN